MRVSHAAFTLGHESQIRGGWLGSESASAARFSSFTGGFEILRIQRFLSAFRPRLEVLWADVLWTVAAALFM